MTTTTATTKAKKSTKATHDPDAVSTVLLASVVRVAGQTQAHEIGLLHEFADAMRAGVLSVRGYRATLKAADDQGAALAFLKAKHGDQLTLISDILKMQGAPATIAEANTTADRLVRIQPSVKGTPKTVTAANVLAAAAAKGKGYEETRKGIDAKFKKAKPVTRKARPAEDPTAPAKADGKPADIADRIADLTAWIMTADYDALTAEVQLALTVLADSIHDKLDDLMA